MKIYLICLDEYGAKIPETKQECEFKITDKPKARSASISGRGKQLPTEYMIRTSRGEGQWRRVFVNKPYPESAGFMYIGDPDYPEYGITVEKLN